MKVYVVIISHRHEWGISPGETKIFEKEEEANNYIRMKDDPAGYWIIPVKITVKEEVE